MQLAPINDRHVNKQKPVQEQSCLYTTLILLLVSLSWRNLCIYSLWYAKEIMAWIMWVDILKYWFYTHCLLILAVTLNWGIGTGVVDCQQTHVAWTSIRGILLAACDQHDHIITITVFIVNIDTHSYIGTQVYYSEILLLAMRQTN